MLRVVYVTNTFFIYLLYTVVKSLKLKVQGGIDLFYCNIL